MNKSDNALAFPFSPLPWGAGATMLSDVHFIRTISDAEGNEIAKVRQGKDQSQEQALANARLMELAPLLLQALEKTVVPLMRLGDFVGNEDKGGASGLGSFDRCEILGEVRQLLAQAHGEKHFVRRLAQPATQPATQPAISPASEAQEAPPSVDQEPANTPTEKSQLEALIEAEGNMIIVKGKAFAVSRIRSEDKLGFFADFHTLEASYQGMNTRATVAGRPGAEVWEVFRLPGSGALVAKFAIHNGKLLALA